MQVYGGSSGFAEGDRQLRGPTATGFNDAGFLNFSIYFMMLVEILGSEFIAVATRQLIGQWLDSF